MLTLAACRDRCVIDGTGAGIVGKLAVGVPRLFDDLALVRGAEYFGHQQRADAVVYRPVAGVVDRTIGPLLHTLQQLMHIGPGLDVFTRDLTNT